MASSYQDIIRKAASDKFTIFGLKGCQLCKKAVNFLRGRNGPSFQFIDIHSTITPEWIQFVSEYNQPTTVPIIFHGSECIGNGYSGLILYFRMSSKPAFDHNSQ